MVAEYTALEIPKYYRTDMIITSLLHDTLEDTDLSEKLISMVFGEQIASQVVDLTRVKSYGKISAAETLNILFQQKKNDVLLIKLFDRLHNMQTIGAKSSEKARKIINETLNNFTVLSEYLRMPNISKEIQTICLNVMTQFEVPHSYIKFTFSFNDNYQPLSLIYQNKKCLRHNL